MFENPRRGRQARNFTTNIPKILDLTSSSQQIFSEHWRWVPLIFAVITLTMYSFLFNSSNFGKFLGYEFYRSCISVQKKKKEAVVLHLHPPENVSLGRFTLLACSGRKNCTKSIMHMQSCCFASLLNQLLLCRSHYCCCCRCLSPLFFSFPAGSSLAPKIIGH